MKRMIRLRTMSAITPCESKCMTTISLEYKIADPMGIYKTEKRESSERENEGEKEKGREYGGYAWT